MRAAAFAAAAVASCAMLPGVLATCPGRTRLPTVPACAHQRAPAFVFPGRGTCPAARQPICARSRAEADEPPASTGGSAALARGDGVEGEAKAARTPCVRICRYKQDFFDGQVCIGTAPTPASSTHQPSRARSSECVANTAGCFRDTHEIASWQRLSGARALSLSFPPSLPPSLSLCLSVCPVRSPLLYPSPCQVPFRPPTPPQRCAFASSPALPRPLPISLSFSLSHAPVSSLSLSLSPSNLPSLELPPSTALSLWEVTRDLCMCACVHVCMCACVHVCMLAYNALLLSRTFLGNTFYREHILQRKRSTENTFYRMLAHNALLLSRAFLGNTFYREHILSYARAQRPPALTPVLCARVFRARESGLSEKKFKNSKTNSKKTLCFARGYSEQEREWAV